MKKVSVYIYKCVAIILSGILLPGCSDPSVKSIGHGYEIVWYNGSEVAIGRGGIEILEPNIIKIAKNGDYVLVEQEVSGEQKKYIILNTASDISSPISFGDFNAALLYLRTKSVNMEYSQMVAPENF